MNKEEYLWLQIIRENGYNLEIPGTTLPSITKPLPLLRNPPIVDIREEDQVITDDIDEDECDKIKCKCEAFG